MLARLHISNFALVEDVALEPGSGLSLFTGETGAGKSILIDAICRLMGSRTSPEDVRSGTPKAVLEAIFDATRLGPGIGRLLEEWGIEAGEDLIIRREIPANGKSRAFINNCSVTAQQLKQLGAQLIDIFGQNEHQTLLDPDSQQELFDRSVGAQEDVASLERLSSEIRKLQSAWKDLQEKEQQRQRNIDILQYQIREIEAAAPGEQEEEDSLARKTMMQNREKIFATCESLLDVILERDGNLLGQLDQVARGVADLERWGAGSGGTLSRLKECEEALRDLTRGLDDQRRSLEFEPGALDEIETRLDALQKLKKKYGPDIPAVLRHLDECKEDLQRELHAEERAEAFVHDMQKLAAEYRTRAGKLSALRNASKSDFEHLVESELQNVAMEKCRFRVALQEQQPAFPESAEASAWMQIPFPRRGWQTVEFEIEPNSGEGFRPLHKIASGASSRA